MPHNYVSKKHINAHKLRTILLHLSFLLLLTCTHFYASAQRKKQVGSAGITHSENLPHHRYLTGEQKEKSEYYRKFLTAKGLPEKLLPFFPYYTINTRYVQDTLIRVYVGKKTLEQKNDYLLIVVPCIKKDTVINNSRTSFYEDHQDAHAAENKGITCYIITTTTNGRTDKTTYKKVTEPTDHVIKYSRNFTEFLTPYNVASYFATAFIIQRPAGIRSSRYIKIQPVVPRIGRGHHNIIKVEFKSAKSGTGQTCCQSPPEPGASLGGTH